MPAATPSPRQLSLPRLFQWRLSQIRDFLLKPLALPGVSPSSANAAVGHQLGRQSRVIMSTRLRTANMLKRLKRPSSWMAIAGVVALSLGAVAAKVVLRDSSQLAVPPELAADQTIPRDHDPVFSLVSLPASQRSVELAKLANGPASATRSRARYLLATDYIAADQGGSAIPLLDGLEAEYPLLAPYVLLQRGNAQRAMGQSEAAQASWQTLVDRYGDDPAAADALYALSKLDPAYGDQLLQKFPGHPRSVETALTRLSQDPNRADTLPLLLLVARYGLYRQEAGAVLNRLTNEFADQLSPEDWQTVGFGY